MINNSADKLNLSKDYTMGHSFNVHDLSSCSAIFSYTQKTSSSHKTMEERLTKL